LLDLPRVKESFEAARLDGWLEESVPFVLREQRLLGRCTKDILLLSLSEPCSDLNLLTGKLSLVILAVVEFRVVCFDGIEKEITVLF